MLTTWKKIIFIFGLIFVACNTSTAADKDVSKAQNQPSSQWEYKVITVNFRAGSQVQLGDTLNKHAREGGWEMFTTATSSRSEIGSGDFIIFLRRPLRE